MAIHRGVKIKLEPYRYGGVLVSFVRKDLQRAINQHMKTMKVEPGPALLQSEEDAQAVFELSSRHMNELSRGYSITVFADPWTAAHCWGWDAHLVFEGGR